MKGDLGGTWESGLRWSTLFVTGTNTITVVGQKGKEVVKDELSFQYQTAQWKSPKKFSSKVTAFQDGIGIVEVSILDQDNVLCLDATNWIRFSLAGDATLIDNLGTSDGSRVV